MGLIGFSEAYNDLKLQTGNSNTGSITIGNGSNKNIEIKPDGNGLLKITSSVDIAQNLNVSGTFNSTGKVTAKDAEISSGVKIGGDLQIGGELTLKGKINVNNIYLHLY